MSDIKNILVNINHGYVHHFLTMLNSLATSNAESNFKVFVLHSDLDESDKEYIFSKISPTITLSFVEVDSLLFKGAPTVKRYPYEIYYRIFAPLMLPEDVERVLYLDCDLVVHGNLNELYNMDFEGNLFIACTQIRKFLQNFNRFRLGVTKDYFYMNTGVMVMNIKSLRPLIDQEKIFAFIKSNGWRMCLYDQDVLYHFFGNKICLVDPLLYNLSDRYIKFYNMRNPKNKVDIEWVEKNNIIIHYIGRNKPWKDNYKGILKSIYKRYEIK